MGKASAVFSGGWSEHKSSQKARKKLFFFEKKNQKTFASCGRRAWPF
jgi:putative SOS response-associated peptidase YedK